MATLAWSAAAFGAVYPWAYLPLVTAAVVLGTIGVTAGRGPLPRALVMALLSIAVVPLIQLVPLGDEIIGAVSPHTLEIHRQRDLAAAVGARDSFPLSIAPRQTALGLTFFASFALLLVGGARMLSRDSARYLAAGIALIGVTISVIGIVQRATFNGRVYGFWPLIQGGIPFGPFINRNHFAGWMLMALPVAIGLFASIVSRGMADLATGWRARALWFATGPANTAVLAAFAVLAMTLALTLTLSRSGVSAIVVAMTFASWLALRRQGATARRYIVPLLFAGAMAAALAAAGTDRLANRFGVAGAIDVDGRRAIWFDTWRMVEDFRLTGTGLNTFGTAALFYQTRLQGSHMQEAHNDYLQIASEGGLLLAIPAFIAVGLLVAGIRRRLREDVGSIWWIRAGAASGLLAIAVQSVVEFSLQIPANAALFAAISAIALHDGGRVVLTRSTPPPAPPAPPIDAGNIVRFDGSDRELEFSIDDRMPSSAGRGDLNLSELDTPNTLERMRVSRNLAGRRADRQPRIHHPWTLGLIALLAVVIFALALLSLVDG